MEDINEIIRLGYYLNRAFTKLVEELDKALRDAGLPLNHSQFSILQVLSRNNTDVLSQREIANRLGKDPAAISRALSYLETNGFVERVPVSGCKNGVSLSAKARNIQPEIECIIRKVTTGACKEMSTDEITGGLSFLKKILQKRRND